MRNGGSSTRVARHVRMVVTDRTHSAEGERHASHTHRPSRSGRM